MFNLIADAGATKINWGLFGNDVSMEFVTSGYNPNVSDSNYLRQLLISGFPSEFDANSIITIEYYGAGCGTNFGIGRVQKALQSFFVNVKKLRISSDLELAGKALFNNETGIACILGTGANAGYFNQGLIEKKAISLGYLLGDEGSGMYLGKTFISKLLRNKLTPEIEYLFYNQFKLTSQTLINEIYNHIQPNKYLAQFVPFLKENIANESIKLLVNQSFNSFISNYIIPLEIKNCSVGFIGGVANAFKKELSKQLELLLYKEIVFIENPIKIIIHTR